MIPAYGGRLRVQTGADALGASRALAVARWAWRMKMNRLELSKPRAARRADGREREGERAGDDGVGAERRGSVHGSASLGCGGRTFPPADLDGDVVRLGRIQATARSGAAIDDQELGAEALGEQADERAVAAHGAAEHGSMNRQGPSLR